MRKEYRSVYKAMRSVLCSNGKDEESASCCTHTHSDVSIEEQGHSQISSVRNRLQILADPLKFSRRRRCCIRPSTPCSKARTMGQINRQRARRMSLSASCLGFVQREERTRVGRRLNGYGGLMPKVSDGRAIRAPPTALVERLLADCLPLSPADPPFYTEAYLVKANIQLGRADPTALIE